MLRIAFYATASTDSAAYIIGGFAGRDVSTIAEYKNNKWRKIGNLNEPKRSSSAILNKGEFIIIGGLVENDYSRATTEVWKFNTKSSRRTNSFSLDYYYNPILFLVDSNFCI